MDTARSLMPAASAMLQRFARVPGERSSAKQPARHGRPGPRPPPCYRSLSAHRARLNVKPRLKYLQIPIIILYQHLDNDLAGIQQSGPWLLPGIARDMENPDIWRCSDFRPDDLEEPDEESHHRRCGPAGTLLRRGCFLLHCITTTLGLTRTPSSQAMTDSWHPTGQLISAWASESSDVSNRAASALTPARARVWMVWATCDWLNDSTPWALVWELTVTPLVASAARYSPW
jgi:hypothetical protein